MGLQQAPHACTTTRVRGQVKCSVALHSRGHDEAVVVLLAERLGNRGLIAAVCCAVQD